MKKLSDVTSNQVIKTTHENDLQFRQLLDKEGYKLHDYGSYLYDRNYNKWYEGKCYIISKGVHYTGVSFESEGKEILNASDFLKPKISKKELLERIETLEERIKELDVWKETFFTVTSLPNAYESTIELLSQDEQKPQFEVGKVYKSTKSKIMFYCTEIKKDRLFGFGFDRSGSWHEIDRDDWSATYLVEATTEEWQARLEEEAVRQGYVEGVKVKCVDSGDIGFLKGGFFNNYQNQYLSAYSVKTEEDGLCIMQNGKWAEIIKPQYEKGMVGLFSNDLEELNKGFGYSCILKEYDKSDSYPFINENGYFFKHFRETEPIKFK